MRPFGPIAAILTALLLAAPATALGAADLTTTVTASPTSLPLGGPETIKVKISVANAGPDAAMAVEAESKLGDPKLLFIGFEAISQGIGIYSGGEKKLVASFGAIPAGKTATVDLVLNDQESGLATVTVTAKTSTEVLNPADDSASVNIDVLALVPAVSPTLFGSQAVGGIGPPVVVSMVNQAAIPIQVSDVQQLANGDFLTSSDGCSGTTVAPGASCPIGARFAPSAAGERTGTMTVTSSTAKVAPISVPLTGTGVPPATADTTAASLALASVPKSIKAKKFKKGFQVGITPSEAAALEVALLGTPKKGALASKFELKLFSSSLPLAAGTRQVKVKPAAKLLGPLRKKISVQLQVVATDAAGNRSTVTRKITVRP
jgi:Domain of unknown function DUF11